MSACIKLPLSIFTGRFLYVIEKWLHGVRRLIYKCVIGNTCSWSSEQLKWGPFALRHCIQSSMEAILTSSIHRITGLGGNFPYTMTYAHRPHFPFTSLQGRVMSSVQALTQTNACWWHSCINGMAYSQTGCSNISHCIIQWQESSSTFDQRMLIVIKFNVKR